MQNLHVVVIFRSEIRTGPFLAWKLEPRGPCTSTPGGASGAGEEVGRWAFLSTVKSTANPQATPRTRSLMNGSGSGKGGPAATSNVR